MYAFFAPLGTISLRLFGVFSNISVILVTLGGVLPSNTTLVKLRQPTKARSSMLVIELGMVILVKLSQPLKAHSPILVIEFGILTLAKLLQPGIFVLFL